ncbi:MAG TPA: hypothetical protein VNU23_05080 [Candidatus Cybelea sp.]|jgi:hypothetical protein|nr:hypothetical protein [Candidatus Cybelea sp.]
MSGRARTIVAVVLGLFIAVAAAADTLELKDGRVLQGRYLGGTQAVLRFEIKGEVETFNVSDAVALTFTGTSSATEAPAPAPPSAATPPPPAAASDSAAPSPEAGQAPVVSQDVPPPAARPTSLAPQTPRAQDPAAQYGEITIPAGQSLLVRMIDGVDSSKNQVGDVFHASLETDLYIRDTLVARKGTDVYGRLAEAKEAGHLSGSAELQLELMRIVIEGHDYPLVSSDYSLKGQGRGADTAKKVGGGAVFGAIIGAIAGGGKGAAIGAGAGSAAGAGVQVFTRGKQVKVPSETLLEFRLEQPATVAATQR